MFQLHLFLPVTIIFFLDLRVDRCNFLRCKIIKNLESFLAQCINSLLCFNVLLKF